MKVIAAIVLAIACVLCLLFFDMLCHVKKNKGVINRLIRHMNRRRKYGKRKCTPLRNELKDYSGELKCLDPLGYKNIRIEQ